MRFLTLIFTFIIASMAWAELPGRINYELNDKVLLSEIDQNNFIDIITKLGYQEMLERAANALKLEEPKDIFQFIYFCSNSQRISNAHYKSPTVSYQVYASGYAEDGVSVDKVALDFETIIAQRFERLQTQVDENPGYTIVRQVNSPEICLEQDRSLLEITKSLLHELFHLIHDDMFHQTDLSNMSKEEFIQQKIEASDGELKAFLFDIEVAKKMRELFDIQKFYSSYSFFIDEAGNIKEDELKDYLLYDLNYLGIYSQMYEDLKQKQQVELFVMERYLRAIEVQHLDALQIAQSNLNLARTRLRQADILTHDLSELYWRESTYSREVNFYQNALDSLEQELAIIYGKLRSFSQTATESSQNGQI